MIRRLFFVLAVIVLVGCDSDSGGGSTTIISNSNDANVEGIWDGISVVTGGTQAPVGTSFTIIFTLSHAGNQVTGTAETAGGLVSPLSGSVTGQVFTFTITQGAPCTGTFSGVGTVSSGDTVITVSYSGSDCSGTLSAIVVAVKR